MTKCLGKRGESWNTPKTRIGHGDSSDNTTTPEVVDPHTFNQGSVATEQLWDTQPQWGTTHLLRLEVVTKQLMTQP